MAAGFRGLTKLIISRYLCRWLSAFSLDGRGPRMEGKDVCALIHIYQRGYPLENLDHIHHSNFKSQLITDLPQSLEIHLGV